MLYSDLHIKDGGGNIKETLKVSKLCFGSLCMGPLQSGLSVKDGAEIIKRAFDSGVNFIDAAQLYRTYPYIKAALDLNAGKNKIIISTKTYAHTRKLAEESLEEALGGLGVDCIDIFMLHEQESIHTIHGHLDALEYLFEQKKAGAIKAVGISTHH
ncbi:MAG: aldo/keto reductase, partial [Oscillospiraceae bacterium]|nr:aldo/keto reductase [Oscillospiraceae bacterium]